MKTGRLLLQSFLSSSLRSGPKSRGGNASFIAAVGAFSFGIVGMVGGVSTTTTRSTALCSSGSSNDTDHPTSPRPPSMTVPEIPPAVATIDNSNKKRGGTIIFEPDKVEHNPALPFPESSLKYDTYNGVTLDITKLSSIPDATTFGIMLGIALDIWRKVGNKGIWLKIPTAQSHLIGPACTMHGFDFQHAEHGYCILTKWLPTSSVSRLPHGPTHQVGVGALVIHPISKKMLAVQERSGPAARAKLWKMPTGLTDPGEDIAVAAVRELKEETGLDCIFDRILCFRQSHGGLFGRSDLFIVCLCKLAPKYDELLLLEGGGGGEDIPLIPQEEEILNAEWIDYDTYANQGLWKGSPLYDEMNRVIQLAVKSESRINNKDDDNVEVAHGFVAKELDVGFRPGKQTIYVSSKL